MQGMILHGNLCLFTQDETIRPETMVEAFSQLKLVFKRVL